MLTNHNATYEITWVNEDELPTMSHAVYSAMFPLSRVDFVRLFPCLNIDGVKCFLIVLSKGGNNAD
jgi:hypothetical protein